MPKFRSPNARNRVARREAILYRCEMRFVARALVLSGIACAGCQTAHDVAVTSWRVIDAPARYVTRHLEGPEDTRTTTTTVVDSDVVTPGRPVEIPPPQSERIPPRRVVQNHVSPSPQSTPLQTNPTPQVGRSSPSPSRNTSPTGPQQASLPTAKPVPDKPGYVFSPFDPNGGYVDVNGYTSGQKVKDPYSGKIFLVP